MTLCTKLRFTIQMEWMSRKLIPEHTHWCRHWYACAHVGIQQLLTRVHAAKAEVYDSTALDGDKDPDDVEVPRLYRHQCICVYKYI